MVKPPHCHAFPANGGLPRPEYESLRRRLLARFPAAWTVLVLLVDMGLILSAAALLQSGSTAGFLGAQLLLVVVYFHGFAIMHDAGHGSAARSRLLNSIIGHYASVFCFLPFYPWKYIHQAHHSWTGNIERDPTLKLVREFDARNRLQNGLARLCWWFWLPAAALLQHGVFWAYPFRLLFERNTRRSARLNCLFSLAFLPAGVWLLHRLWPEVVQWRNLWPSILAYLVVVELVNLPHHLDTELADDPTPAGKLPVWRQSVATRSCYYPFPISEALFLNFNFHVEHHTFPSLPWWLLRRVREELREKVAGYQECHGIGWNIANRRRDLFEVAIPPWRRATTAAAKSVQTPP